MLLTAATRMIFIVEYVLAKYIFAGVASMMLVLLDAQ
jgi:hypothetical protein